MEETDMKNLFALLGFSIVVLGAIGWHQGWYKFNVTKNTDGTLRVQTDVNTTRASDDIVIWGQNVGEWIKNKPANAAVSTPAPQTQQPPADSTSRRPLKEGAGWLMSNIVGSK